MIFHLAWVKYNNHRISFEELPKHKQRMQYLELPDGQKYGKRIAFIRYVWRLYGFYPTDSL